MAKTKDTKAGTDGSKTVWHFEDLPAGTQFFDPISQEEFVKISGTHALMTTWEANRSNKADEFEPDDVVRPLGEKSRELSAEILARIQHTPKH